MCLKTTHFKLQLHLPGTNEFNNHYQITVTQTKTAWLHVGYIGTHAIATTQTLFLSQTSGFVTCGSLVVVYRKRWLPHRIESRTSFCHVWHLFQGCKSFWNFIQRTTMRLLGCVPNFRMVWLLRTKLQGNEILRDLRFGRICFLVLPVAHFTNKLWAYHWRLVKSRFALILIPMIKWGHKFTHATTA